MKLDIISRIRNLKIGGKLIISYILVVFLPVLLVGSILIHSMRQMVLDRSINEATVNVDRIYSLLNEALKTAMDISYKAHIDQDLESLVLRNYTDTKEVFDAYSQYYEFNNYTNLYSRQIKNIKFYTYNGTLLDNGQFIKITPEILNTDWYGKVVKADGRILWQYLASENSQNRSMCLTTVVKANLGYKNIGILNIAINDAYLYYLLKNEPYETFICDDLGNIIAAKDTSMSGLNIRSTGISSAFAMDAGVHELNYRHDASKLIIKNFSPSIKNGSFKIISLIPMQVLEKQTAGTAMLGILIMGSSLLLAFILIIFFTNAISRRIRRLSTDMHKVAQGDFNVIPLIEGLDEIGQLSRDLDTMIRSIKELVHENYEANLQKNQLAIKQREIKLKMLANQINPHFLFNSLETIRMKAHCSGQEEIAWAVKLLGKIMRKNLEISNEYVTLEWEIDLVKSYLEIQKFRYGSRIQYEIRMDPSLSNYPIMPLTLQPIVENSVVHGLEEKKGEGIVCIDIYTKKDFLIVCIEDNGLGMSSERLEYVIDSLCDPQDHPGKRIGIKNVYQRIKISYGDDYGLSIRSKQGEGTKIEIVLPRKVGAYA